MQGFHCIFAVFTSCPVWQSPIIYETSPRNIGPAQHSHIISDIFHLPGPEDKLFSFVFHFDIILSLCSHFWAVWVECALAFMVFNEAGFDSILYQVSSFVCLGRKTEKCSFNWQKKRQIKTRKKSDNYFFPLKSQPLSKTCYSSIFQISWESYLSTTAFPYFLETYITGCIINVYANHKEESNIS